MDTEISEAIESVRGDIRRVETTLSAEIGKIRAVMVTRADLAAGLASVREELRGEMASMREELRGEMASMREELRGEMASMREELRGEMTSMREEINRHTDMRYESLRDDIRLIAEGFAHLSARIDQRQPPGA